MPNESYKISFKCPVMAVDVLSEAFYLLPCSISSFETKNKEIWSFELYFAEQIQLSLIKEILVKNCALLKIVVPKLKQEKLEDLDWVKESKDSFKPIDAADFYIFPSWNVADVSSKLNQGKIAIQIDPSQAFGTGQHETTKACLKAISILQHDKFMPHRVLDLGTGSGILAIAAKKIWQGANVVASDIDAKAIDIAKDNAALNLNQTEGIENFIVSDGVNSKLQNLGPYDLILANILANPLIALSNPIRSVTASTGYLVLSGFYNDQVEEILNCYSQKGFKLVKQIKMKKWCALVLRGNW